MTIVLKSVTRRLLLARSGWALALAAGSSGATIAQDAGRNAQPAWQHRLVAAGRTQIGTTIRYDPAYTHLAFPNGDVPRDRGVCTDVVIRAYRDAFGLDLQALVNADMRQNFSAYPKAWGATHPDPSIDHRRVLNLRVFLQRRGASAGPGAPRPEAFEAGDIVTMTLPGNLPHIGIVSDHAADTSSADARHRVIHNIGAGAEESDILAQYALTGRYRLKPV